MAQREILEPGGPSGHLDTFTRDRLPPREAWAPTDYSVLPQLAAYPDRINLAAVLLSARIAAGDGARTAIVFEGRRWTYAELESLSDRIARVLVEDLGLVSGNRVLIRGPNNPSWVASWLGVLKAGGVCVATMPLLRARELSYIVAKARIRHALCDLSLAAELERTRAEIPELAHVSYFTNTGDKGAA